MSDPRHIALSLPMQEVLLRQSLYATLLEAVLATPPTDQAPLRVLDVGSGRGEVLRLLAERGYIPTGLDMEPGCVEAGGRYGRCLLGGVEEIPRLFQPGEFDAVICSHVLEHLDHPLGALIRLRALQARRYVLAVPNPLRSIRMVRALVGSRRPDHPEHVFAWGHAEFSALLGRAGLRPVRGYADRVTIKPFHGRVGQTLTRFLQRLEVKLLPRAFPLLASSIIVACEPVPHHPEP